MKKNEAIKLLNSEGWTKADATRAIASINFDTNPDEITIRRTASQFAGNELFNRQRLQASQKGLVTKKTNEIQKYINQIEELKLEIKKLKSDISISNPDLAKRLKELSDKNIELTKVNQQLQKDNKDLKNIVDAIRLKLTIETKHLLKLENSEIKKGLVKLLKSTLG